jgi:flagellar basal body-associated protein FliL
MKGKKKMKKNLKIIVLAIVVVLLIVAVGYFAVLKTEERQVNEKIDSMFENLISSEDNSQKQEIFNSIGESDEDNSAYNLLFSKITYSVKKVDSKWKKADVTLEVTNKNMKEVIINYFTQTFKLSFANAFSNTYTEEELNEQLNQYLQEQLESDEIENITTEVTINMTKENGEWNISQENKTELINAILPGFEEVVNQINESLNVSNN